MPSPRVTWNAPRSGPRPPGAGRRTWRTGGDPVPRENAGARALRFLAEGRVMILTVRSTSVLAHVRGDSGSIREVTWDALRGWRCTCPAVGPCGHGMAVAQVVVVSQAPTLREAAS